MSKEKRIYEISEHLRLLINNIDGHCSDLSKKTCDKNNCLECLSQFLIEMHWRSEYLIIWEVFEAIEKRIESLEYHANTSRKTVAVEELVEQVNWVLHEVVPKTIAELKQERYGEYYELHK